MRTAAQHMTTKALPTKTTKGTKRIPIKPVVEPQDYSKIEVKANGFTALALVDLQTKGGDLINAQFVYIHRIPTKEIEKKSLNTAIKGSKGTIDKSCEINLNWLGYTETRILYVAHLSGWDIILGEPALTSVNSAMAPGSCPVSIQQAGI